MSETETFSSMPAALTSFEAIVTEILQKRAFLKRRYAWIAEHGDLFLKIPRIGEQAERDALSAEAQAMAKQEFDELTILANLTPSVVRPTALVHPYACLILPKLLGSDLRPVLQQQPRSSRSQRAIVNALRILANIHKVSRGQPPGTLSRKVYPRELPAESRAPGTEKVITIEGFEIRNFLLQDDTGRIRFYDPHFLSIGYPEEDVMRFVLSLLMLNWSRSLRCKAWTSFHYAHLLDCYEEESGGRLKPDRLRFCFQTNLQLRFANASKSIAAMPAVIRPMAKIYRNLYFEQIHNWAAHHEL